MAFEEMKKAMPHGNMKFSFILYYIQVRTQELRYIELSPIYATVSVKGGLFTEMGKNQRERRSFQFTHERGSYLAHIFSKFSFMNVAHIFAHVQCSRSFHIHFAFTSHR